MDTKLIKKLICKYALDILPNGIWTWIQPKIHMYVYVNEKYYGRTSININELVCIVTSHFMYTASYSEITPFRVSGIPGGRISRREIDKGMFTEFPIVSHVLLSIN